MDIFEKIHRLGILPVVVLDDVKDAALLAIALCKGGLPAAEVTYRTACAHDVIQEMKKVKPDMLVGAGTVLSIEQVDSAIDAGAEFIVSPGFNPSVVAYCIKKGVPVIPGTATPSDIEKALSMGLSNVKFFPSEINGGVKAIQALGAPYVDVKFLPTGGVSEKSLLDYMKCKRVLACGGTWMVKKEWIKNGDFKAIEDCTKKAVFTMLNLQIKGLSNDKKYLKITTPSIDRALYHLANMGIAFKDYVNDKYHIVLKEE